MQETLLSIKNARKNVQLRSMEGPEAAKELQNILQQAIQMQASGSALFQKKALEEIKQIHSDMVAGQISAGSKTSQIVGVYGHVIDQIEAVTKNAESNNALMGDTLNKFSKSIPSVDSLIGALMTANPVLGLGVKVLRDLQKARRDAKEKASAEYKKRLSVVNEQRNYIESQLALLDDQKALADQQAKAEKKNDNTLKLDGPVEVIEQENDDKGPGEYTNVLNDIKTTMDNLYRVWEPDNGALTKVDVDSPEMALEKTAEDEKQDELIRVNQEVVDKLDDLIDTELALEDRRERNAKLSRVRDTSTDSDFMPPEHLETKAVSEDKGGPLGGLLAMLRGFGMLAGLGAGAGILASMLSPIKLLFSFIGSFGKMAMSIASKLILPAAIIGSIYSFFEGFFEADRILGLHDSDISIGDRIATGIANVTTSLWKWADSIVETLTFGVLGLGDTSDVGEITTGLAKRLIDVKNDLYDWFLSGFIDTEEMFKMDRDATTKDKIIGGIANLTESALKYADWLVETLSFGYFDLGNVQDAGLKQKVFDGLQTASNKLYDWLFKGFFDTETIGIDNSEATLYERVQSGFANIQASLWKMVDWLVESVTFGTVDLISNTENLPQRIHEFFNSLPEKLVEFMDATTAALSSALDQAVAKITEVFSAIPEKFTEIYNSVLGEFDSLTDSFSGGGMTDWLFGGDDTTPILENGATGTNGAFIPEEVFQQQQAQYGRGFGQLVDPSAPYRTTAMDEMDAMTRKAIDEKIQSNLNSFVSAPQSNVTNVKTSVVEASSTSNSNPRLKLAWQ